MGVLDKMFGAGELKGIAEEVKKFNVIHDRIAVAAERSAEAAERSAAALEDYNKTAKIAMGIVKESAATETAPAKTGKK